MNTPATSAAWPSWSELLAAGCSDTRPWLIVPENACRGAEHRAWSYAELDALATRIFGALRERGGRPGDRVMVVADNSLEASALLLSVIAGGMVAVPVAPRTLGMQLARWQARLRAVGADCEPRFVVGRCERLPEPEVVSGARSCSFDELNEGARDTAPLPIARPEHAALIQYTSGTTGTPRGAVLTHANIAHNLRAIGQAVAVDERDVVLTWLPLFHDMGLIGSLLFATYFRLPFVLMTPSEFLLRPEAWLWAISRFRVSCCAAPNSAYQSCATKIPERKLQGLDLACWRAALNGSELVHAATLDAFCERFRGHGFAPSAMLPVYGLAENTVAATCPSYGAPPTVDWVDRHALESDQRARPSGAGADRSRGVVCVGSPLAGQALRIVDDGSGDVLDERRVGAIELRGPSVMRGYHGASATSISPDGWLRTGDRGYLLDGELYVVGRSKEVINRAGRKHDAMDVQSAVKDVAGIRAGRVAAFGVPNESTGTEDVVVMAETELRSGADHTRLAATLGKRLQELLALRPDRIVLVAPGVIPRTTSGKVQHLRARADYLAAMARTAIESGVVPGQPTLPLVSKA